MLVLVNPQRFYRYFKFQVSTEIALENMKKKILNKRIPSYLSIEKFDPTTGSEFLVQIYNRTFLVAADPYASIGLKEITAVDPEGILVVKMFNKIVGFAYLKIRKENGQNIGEIAIVGVTPEKRRQGIATALSVKIAEYFLERNVQILECEVYEKNNASLAYISAFGFEQVGERLARVDEEVDDLKKEMNKQQRLLKIRKRLKLHK